MIKLLWGRNEQVGSDYDEVKSRIGGNIQLNCAQIVSVKVKYFQIITNKTKRALKK